MPIFRDTDELYQVMGAMFEAIRNDSEISSRLAEARLVLRFRWREPDGEATVDLRQEPISFQLGPCDLAPDVEMRQSADVAHRFWLGRLRVPQAIATGQVVARGSVPKALKLLPAIRPAFLIYPDVLRKLGRGDLVPAVPEERRKVRFLPGFRLPFRRKKSRILHSRDILNTHLIPMARAVVDDEPQVSHEAASGSSEAPLDLLRQMLRIRSFEEHLSQAFADGSVPTEAIHLSIGQEATAVGACAVLGPADTMVTTHRGHGHMIARGADLGGMMAEIYGKVTGLCGGKGGSMHVTDSSVGALGANGIVGASPLIATGAALAETLRGGSSVSLAFMGDGATNQGMFHEALNFAAVFRTPAVFVVENNLYGEFTPLADHTRVPRLADRAAAYGMPGSQVDGNDVEAVMAVVREAVERARRGEGPSLVECLTYRWHGHMEGEQASYRSQEEIARWKEKDPIVVWQSRLEERGLLSPEQATALAEEAREEVASAVVAARAAGDPPLASLSEHVFAPELPELYADTGDSPSTQREITCSAALREALAEEMARDSSVFLLGEDVSQGGYFAVTTGLGEEFPNRVLDTPISEYAIVGAAVGAAMRGMRPVAEILFSDFLTTCMDPLVNQAAKLRYMSGGQYAIPLVVRTPGGAGLGMAAQHSQSLEALLTGIPGLIIVAPSTPHDAKGLLKTAIRSNNPVVFFENKLLYLQTGSVPEEDYLVPLGQAVVRRKGRDVTVVAVGGMMPTVLAAAETLAERRVEVEVIDPRTLVPLDSATIVQSVAKTGRLVTVEEGHLTHGFGAEIIARVAESVAPSTFKARPRRVAAPNIPIPYARNLEQAAIPDENDIVEAVLRALGR